MNQYSAEVLVIGAGAAGAAVTWSLASKGLRVICVEQGEFYLPNEFPGKDNFWELSREKKFSPFPNVRNLASDYPIDDSNSPIAIANFNAVGGSTVLYSGHFPRMHPSDFRVRSLDGVADDWPISYQELEPYFRINDKMMGVAGLAGDPAYPPIAGLLPPVPIGLIGLQIAQGFNNLGWHWWPSYSAISTVNSNGRSQCMNLGPCNTGCAQGAKSSADIAYWPRALQAGAILHTRTRVLRIAVDDNMCVRRVIARTRDGEEAIYEAKVVVLACNGVGTPRLLLESTSKQFPNGLANSSGLVGKNLMLHPCGVAEGIFDSDLDSDKGPQGCCIYSHEHYETDTARGFVRGYTLQILRGPGPVDTALEGVGRRRIRWGLHHGRDFAHRYRKIGRIAVVCEDLPDVANTVTLDPLRTDNDGVRIPVITYRLSQNSKRMLAHGISSARRVLSSAGAIETMGFGPVRGTGWHLMGTTRMGNDPKMSVVDHRGRCHDVKNLYVADSSVFVTSGGVNPTSTLQAISLLIADGIADDFQIQKS